MKVFYIIIVSLLLAVSMKNHLSAQTSSVFHREGSSPKNIVEYESRASLIPASEFDLENSPNPTRIKDSSNEPRELIEQKPYHESTASLIPASEFDLENNPNPTRIKDSSDEPRELIEQKPYHESKAPLIPASEFDFKKSPTPTRVEVNSDVPNNLKERERGK